jgi:hypothetical protein
VNAVCSSLTATKALLRLMFYLGRIAFRLTTVSILKAILKTCIGLKIA